MDNLGVYRCIISAKVGEITNKKVNALSEILKNAYPTVALSEDNASILFNNDKDNISIMLNSNQIVCSKVGGNVTIDDLDNFQTPIEDIFKTLLLNDKVNVGYNFVFYPPCTTSALEHSRRFVPKQLLENPNLIGFGIRSFFKYNDVLSEIRIEPFLSDDKKFYIETLISCKNKEYKDVTNEANNAYTYLKGVYEDLINNLI